MEAGKECITNVQRRAADSSKNSLKPSSLFQNKVTVCILCVLTVRKKNCFSPSFHTELKAVIIDVASTVHQALSGAVPEVLMWAAPLEVQLYQHCH